jgi:hypothetical protein
MMKVERKTWDEKMQSLKGEKKKLEYIIFDMLKPSEANKDKLKEIKKIGDGRLLIPVMLYLCPKNF